TFENQVDVVRSFPGGVNDQMTSDALTVWFAPKQSPAGKSDAGTNAKPASIQPADPNAAPKRTSNLEPRRIEARGSPVILRAESNGVYARAEHIDYDIATGRVALDDAREIMLRQFANEIHCRSLEYTPGEEGRLGQLEAIGPGWLRAIPRQASTTLNGRSNLPTQPLPAPSASMGVTQLGLPIVQSHRPPPQAAGQFFEAHWSDKLTMRPDGTEHVVSLLGSARAGMTGEGELAADQIFLWLKEVPVAESQASQQPAAGALTEKPRWQVAADKLLARPSVRIDSIQLAGSTALLEAWFEQAAPDQIAARAPNAPFGSGGQFGTGPARQGAPTAFPAFGQRGPVGPSTAGRVAQQTAGAPRQQQQPQRFDVGGDRIMARFITAPQRTDVQDITIDGHAHFGESQTAQPGDVPLLVTGDEIEVVRASEPDTVVTVSGKPAEVAARGLEMYGDVVHLDKGSNRVWIDAPGRMKLPASQSVAAGSPAFPTAAMGTPASSAYPPPDNRFGAVGAAPSTMRPSAPAAHPDPMIVTWKDRMVFDGRTAHFEHSVDGNSKSRTFKTDLLDVSLLRRIDFAQPHMEERAEIDRIDCQGGMWMETRTFDPYDPQKLVSLDRMQTSDLSINETTGEILGHGPGWLTSIRRGSADPTATAHVQAAGDSINHPKASTVAQTDPSAKPASGRHRSTRSGSLLSEKSQLNYLNVQFDGPLSGNLNLHEIVFHDRVRSVYGPVMSWDDQLNPDDVDDLGDGGALMTCDIMKVRQTNDKPPPGADDRRPIELEAIGNASVEGEQYRALAARMTYTESKDLLTLEGDGRRDASLYRQERPGDPRADTTAKTIFVYFGHSGPDGGRSIRDVSVNHPSFFELNQLPGQNSATPASKPGDSKPTKRGAKQ
ncbi:MAG TPA: hypothetical protein VKB78_08170, partial [Pirellulales bacterium]|nr:hypothetical protein [Pirellulales bacterium]